MLQANQDALAHNTNIAIVNIRNAELSYFQTFFLGFGFQIGLIAGFNLNVISQTVSSSATCSEFWLYLYWINNALGSIFGIMAILIALLTNVYGQGLALRGPAGSMARAIDGMIEEQRRFLMYFALCTLCTAVSFIGNFFIMMLEDGAWASGSIIVIGIGFWYVSIVRIINRFQHTVDKDQFATMNQAEEFNNEFDYAPMAASPESSSPVSPTPATAGKKPIAQPQQPMVLDQETGEVVPMYDSSVTAKSHGSTQLVTQYQANIVMKSPTGAWNRCHMVIKGSFALYYKSKQAFESAPMEPINGRPLIIADFNIECAIAKDSYSIVLTPVDPDDDRKPLEFRTDTEQEMHNWKAALVRAKAAGGRK